MSEIICGDSKEVLAGFEAESVDLVVTSPPYDNLRDYKGYTFDFEGIAGQLYRVLKHGGVIVWVVGDQVIDGSESGTSFRQALSFMSLGFRLHDTMIYEKNGSPFPEQVRYYQCFEYMFVLSKGSPKSVNLLKDRKNRWSGSFGKRSYRQKDGTLKVAEKIICEDVGVRFNIWRIDGGFGRSTQDTEAYKHPAIFPEALARDHIYSWSNEGDTVLDPFNGSGTTTKMAKSLGRQYIGIDISEEYCEIARQRLLAQPNPLFIN